MRRKRFLPVAIAALVPALAAAGNSPGSTAIPEGAAEGTGRAIVTVSTPGLPAGRSAAARERWHLLRARSRELLDSVAEEAGLEVAVRIPETGKLGVELGEASIAALSRRLASDPRVESVRPDLPVELRYAPSDFGFNQLDANAPNGDLFQWPLPRYGSAAAWDLSRGAGAEVAIADTGSDGAHPDLAPQIVAAAGYGTPPAPGPTVDQVGHGTHVAGLACADSDSAGGFGIASAGFDCALFVQKVELLCSNLAAAIADAGTRRSDAINLSLGGCDSSLSDELNYAWSRGSVPVAAGANEPVPDPGTNYPAQFAQPQGTGPNLDFNRGLVVTATKYDWSRAAFAQKTSGVSVAAFGAAIQETSGGQQGILSTFPGNVTEFDLDGCGCRRTLSGSDDFAYLVGTSMATPQVSGLVALMRAAKPALENTKLVRLVKATASHCGIYGDGIGWGVIRADRAVGAALGRDVDAPTSRVRSAKVARRSGAAASARRGRIVNLRLKRSDQSCSKELPVSGVKTVNVFASANGGRYHRIRKTKKKKIRFRAKRRRSYRFYAVAVDKAGNREPAPQVADAKLKR